MLIHAFLAAGAVTGAVVLNASGRVISAARSRLREVARVIYAVPLSRFVAFGEFCPAGEVGL